MIESSQPPVILEQRVRKKFFASLENDSCGLAVKDLAVGILSKQQLC